MGILSMLLPFVNPLEKIAKSISEHKIAMANVELSEEKLYHEERIKQFETQQLILLEETKHAITRWIRPCFAMPFVIYNMKVMVWDKVLGLGTTDSLSAEMWYIEGAIIGFYFAGRPIEKWLNKGK